MTDGNTRSGVRIRKLLLGSVAGKGHGYGAEFTDEAGRWIPLSVIAGPTQTGKTSIAEFILYCLGDNQLPAHPEIVASVRSALLEAELDGQVTTIERAASGQKSSFASVWPAGIGALTPEDELRVPIEPTSAPDGLSQLILAACGLEGIALPESPRQAESGTHVLSIRDVFRVMWLPNERVATKQDRDRADAEVDEAAEALNRVAQLPAPFLAQRDSLAAQLTQAQVELQRVESGLRLWARVRAAEATAERLTGQATRLRREQRGAETRADRGDVVQRLSHRFAAILYDLDYPKLTEPYLDANLVPHVRGLPYSAASSGGLTLISLAFYLALFEVAWESQGRRPGLLMIDSPQKNLGHAAVEANDPDFADARIVDNFYAHIRRWLNGDGAGAQMIVIDNSPPEAVSDCVVVRYTRDRAHGPYGLIDDALD